MTRHSFKFVSEQAATDTNLNNRQKVLFHYFNPNGLIAAKRRRDDQITELVNNGKAKGGAIFAHGSFNDYYEKRLSSLLDRTRVRASEINTLARGLRRDIEAADHFISARREAA